MNGLPAGYTEPVGNQTCAHCGLLIIGYGSVNDAPLCHPTTGLDCYHLVTLYRHSMPCDSAYCVAAVARRQAREQNSTVQA